MHTRTVLTINHLTIIYCTEQELDRHINHQLKLHFLRTSTDVSIIIIKRYLLRSFTKNKKVKISFFKAQYSVHWTAQSAFHLCPPPPMADLFFPTPTRLLWEALRSNYEWRLFTHMSTTVYSHSQELIYTAESTGASWREQKYSIFETVGKGGFKRWLT